MTVSVGRWGLVVLLVRVGRALGGQALDGDCSRVETLAVLGHFYVKP